jgi:glutathione peroxidase
MKQTCILFTKEDENQETPGRLSLVTRHFFLHMKRLSLFLIILLSVGFMKAQTSQDVPDIYGFTVKTINGDDFPLSSLKGKKVMIVNVASKCGLTPQYAKLQELYDQYKDKNFVIIGFPANNFGAQEPGTNEEIKEFCSLTYGVTFPMMSKISVKGEDIAPLYKWLTSKAANGISDAEVSWNFQKFLIDENGHWVKTVAPKVLPDAEEIVTWINGTVR